MSPDAAIPRNPELSARRLAAQSGVRDWPPGIKVGIEFSVGSIGFSTKNSSGLLRALRDKGREA